MFTSQNVAVIELGEKQLQMNNYVKYKFTIQAMHYGQNPADPFVWHLATEVGVTFYKTVVGCGREHGVTRI